MSSFQGAGHEQDFANILDMLLFIKTEVERFNNEKTLFARFKLISISDSIIVTVPYHDQIATIGISRIAKRLQLELLLRYKQLVRGYITKGNCYHKNGIIFGDGYIKAYMGETSQKGKGPRIVLDPLLIEDAKEKTQNIPANYTTIFEDLNKDVDGNFFIDYFNPTGINRVVPKNALKQSIVEITDYVRVKIAECSECSSVRTKYQWLLTYAEGSLKKFYLD